MGKNLPEKKIIVFLNDRKNMRIYRRVRFHVENYSFFLKFDHLNKIHLCDKAFQRSATSFYKIKITEISQGIGFQTIFILNSFLFLIPAINYFCHFLSYRLPQNDQDTLLE